VPRVARRARLKQHGTAILVAPSVPAAPVLACRPWTCGPSAWCEPWWRLRRCWSRVTGAGAGGEGKRPSPRVVRGDPFGPGAGRPARTAFQRFLPIKYLWNRSKKFQCYRYTQKISRKSAKTTEVFAAENAFPPATTGRAAPTCVAPGPLASPAPPPPSPTSSPRRSRQHASPPLFPLPPPRAARPATGKSRSRFASTFSIVSGGSPGAPRSRVVPRRPVPPSSLPLAPVTANRSLFADPAEPPSVPTVTLCMFADALLIPRTNPRPYPPPLSPAVHFPSHKP